MSTMKLWPGLVLALATASAPLAATAAVAADDHDVYARAEASGEIVTETLDDGRYRVRVPLSAVRAEQGGMRLLGASAEDRLYVAVAPQAKVESAKLRLRHASSRAQADTAPHLKLYLNGQFAAQMDASTHHAAVVDEITLSPGDFRTGFNEFRIEAVQRHTYQCQDPTAPELWTDIHTDRSELEVIYSRRPFAGRLADLDAFVSPGLGGVDQLAIVTGSNSPDAAQLRWGALVSQAVANRLDYKIPELSHAAGALSPTPTQGPASHLTLDPSDSPAGADIAIVGLFEDVGAFLDIDAKDIAPDAGYLAVGPSPADPTRFVIVASGHSVAAVNRAVDALSAANFPFADDNTALIVEADAADRGTLAANGPARLGAAYAFADLGLPTHTIAGVEGGQATLPIELPADVFMREDDVVQLSLDFAYGAGLEPDSALNVSVNGVFRRAVPLDNPRGDVHADYQVDLPARVFQPGPNAIKFYAALNSEHEGECAVRNLNNLAFVLDGSSLVRLPDAPRYAELPNLALMSKTGYPFSAASSDAFAIRAADRSSATLASVWTLAAKLGQMHHANFRSAEIGFGGAHAELNTLVVGSRASVNRVADSALALAPDMSMTSASAQGVVTRQFAALGRNGLMLSAENPNAPGRLLTIVTAETDAALLNSVRNLVDASHWSQLSGGAAVWRENPNTFATQASTARFFIGDMQGEDLAAFENSRAPLMWIATLAGLLFAISTALAILARYMRRKMDG